MSSFPLSNARTAAPVSLGTIQHEVDQARTSFKLSKDSAAAAAAHAYMVWLDTQSPSATPLMRAEIAKQIAALNEAIDKHNAEEAKLKDRVKRYANNTLKKTDAAAIEPTTDAERKEVEAERATLAALTSLSDEDWQARRKVRIERRNDASLFAEIVKYVLGFDRRADASVTSRYATVLEWIDENFDDATMQCAADIVTAIKAAGGFEKVLDDQRKKDKPSDEEAAEDRACQAEAIAQEAKAALAVAAPKAAFNMDVTHAPDGIVTLLARYVDGVVEIIGELPADEKQLERAIALFDDERLMPSYDRSEFVSRVLDLGELVREGVKTDKKVDGLKAGAALEAERVLSVLPDAATGVQLVMSARYADASVIVKATPVKQGMGFGVVASPVMLNGNARKALHKQIVKRSLRRLVDIVPESVGGELRWVACDKALIEKKRENGRRSYCFADMGAQAHKPLDVDGFKPQFSVVVDAAELRKLFDERLEMWAKSESGKKGSKVMSLEFSNGSLVHKVEGAADLKLAYTGATAGVFGLTFLPRDLHDVVKALLAQRAGSFEVSGDTGGLLCLKWTDGVGAYEVYLPTATASGGLNAKRIEPMRCEAAIAQAA